MEYKCLLPTGVSFYDIHGKLKKCLKAPISVRVTKGNWREKSWWKKNMFSAMTPSHVPFLNAKKVNRAGFLLRLVAQACKNSANLKSYGLSPSFPNKNKKYLTSRKKETMSQVLMALLACTLWSSNVSWFLHHCIATVLIVFQFQLSHDNYLYPIQLYHYVYIGW